MAGKNKAPILLVNSKDYNDGNAANNTNDVTIAGSNSYLQINVTINVYILGGTGVLPTGSNAGIDLEKEIGSNLVEGVSVSFVIYEGDNFKSFRVFSCLTMDCGTHTQEP